MRHAFVAVFMLALGALAACDGGNEPRPTPTPTSTTDSPRPTVAPAVHDALDLRPHRLRTCALLTKSQVAELDFPPQNSEGASREGGLCEWFADRSGPGRTETYLFNLHADVAGDPLAAAYRESNDAVGDRPVWQLFDERTVGGLPAVVRSRDDPAASCQVVVGAGNGQGITMSASTGGSDPRLCDRMVTAATWVVDRARG